MKHFLFLACLICCYNTLIAQSVTHPENIGFHKELQQQLSEVPFISPTKNIAAKTTATGMVFDTLNWAHLVDSTWGPGISTAEKLAVFNTFWAQIDSYYSCFVQLPMYNWDSIVNAMRTEISGGVSKGRFAGIAAQLMNYINDGHTHFIDVNVNSSAVYPGKPVFRAETGRFGACVTMLDDTSAMIYSVVAGHPMGLQPGDIILGYNGMPWTKLVATILRHQLPMAFSRASSMEATYHRYIKAAGENWYLFDTINILKCNGTTVSLPTSLMVGTSYYYFCTEQMPVPGVHKMTYNEYYTNGRMTTSGVITGTGIGYVALYDCMNISGDSLYKAVRTLVQDSLVDGLILDTRTNFGGSVLSFYPAFMYLNNGDVSFMGEGDRVSFTDRYTMFNYPGFFDVFDTAANFFDKKIALLTGPGAISAGDMLPVLYTRHPKLKSFGKSTAGAFGASNSVPLPNASYIGARQAGNFFDADNPAYYLSHTNYPVDSPMWFNRTSVCNGVDNILRAAMIWIKPQLGLTDISSVSPTIKVYPNPSTGNFNIVLNTPYTGNVQLHLYNIMGLDVCSANAAVSAGENKLKIDYSTFRLPVGSYLLTIRGNGMETLTRKVMIVD